jgi:HEPN domain-containing protein
MSPAEDPLLLLAIVRRHLRTLRFGLDRAYPEEDWGFTAQQAVEKPLKAWIVLADRRPPRLHALADLAGSGESAPGACAGDAAGVWVEARYEEGPFPLPVPREERLALMEAELGRCEGRVEELGESAG